MLVKFKNVTTLLQQTPSGGYRTIKLQSDLALSLEIYFRCSWTLVFYLLIRTKDGFHIPHVMPIPVDICWSSRRLQHVFSVTSFRLSRRHKDVLEDKKLLRWRRLENVLKRCLEDMSWRRLGDKQNVYWGCLYVTNLNVYLTNQYFTNLYLTNPRRIQNVLIRTQ